MESGNRKYSRCDFSQIIQYAFTTQLAGQTSTGLLQDFSYSGLCMLTHDPLHEGQEIVIKSSLTADPITAVVRWCNNTGNSNYKIGLELKK